MCGFAGIIVYGNEGQAHRGELLRMACRMALRGPDGEGVWISPDRRVGLAHRRLAIIDPNPRSAQPMVSADGSMVIVFNGEIYNYRELRRDLEIRGAEFKTASDTEVLLHLYRIFGERMVDRLRGMYAFAIWDGHEKSMFLARDPFGIKPLYYSDDGRVFRFASQVKALLAGGGISARVSPAGMAGFFLWGHVPEPWTWLEQVRAFPPGVCQKVSPDRGAAPPSHFFDLKEEIRRSADLARVRKRDLEGILEAIRDSVRHHLVSDVPVGLFLSSGRDSSLVGSLASSVCGKGLRAVTLGFDEYAGRVHDEVPLAIEVAVQLGIDHQVHRIRRCDFEAERERLLDLMDQPSIDGVNTYFVARAAARSGLKVALSGLGGDELFGGYASYHQIPNMMRMLGPFRSIPVLGEMFRILSGPLFRRMRRPKGAGLLEYGGTLPGAYLMRRALFMPWEIGRLMDPELARRGLEELDVIGSLRSRIDGIRKREFQVMALEMNFYMRNQLLRDADWAGMAHSLEIRVPLVDVDLFRRVLPLCGNEFPVDRSLLLWKASPAIGSLLSKRPKTGFMIPTESWVGGGRGLRRWAGQVSSVFAPGLRPFSVAMLVGDAFGGIGGIAQFNRDFIGALSGMPDCRRVVVFPRLVQRPPEPLPEKVECRWGAAKGKAAFAWSVVREALFNTGRYDVVVCGLLSLLPAAWFLSRIKGSKLIQVIHGIEAWSPHRSLLVRSLLGGINIFLSVSELTKKRMIDWSSLPEDKFRVFPNCSDLDRYVRRDPQPGLSGKYGIHGRRPVLITVARLAGRERYKGFDEVMGVVTDLSLEYPDLVYVIVGDGDDRARLEGKARELGISNRVVFTGYVGEEDKIDLYNLSDVFVMPGRGEGFGIVYLEAMACGVPVIGSVRDASREALMDGKLGLLVDPEDREGLKAAIREALRRPRGRPPGLEYFGRERFRKRTSAVIRHVLFH